MRNLLTLLGLLLCAAPVWSKGLELSPKELASPPPRIIRTCCSFGADVKVMMIPGLKVTEITSTQRMGPHKYLGDSGEQNGIVYTNRGGFIDMGHLRDQADWTAYLYARILQNKKQGINYQVLGHEGGQKTLILDVPSDISNQDAMQLAGKIAYDLSVWHEIATWFGASSIPFVSERFSSFSVEDAYSNLLGVQLGIKALQSDLPFEEAMTQLIQESMRDLLAVESEEEIRNAMEAVRGIWWTREKRLPSRKILLRRDVNVYPTVKPMLVPGWAAENPDNYALQVPMLLSNGQPLSSHYQLTFRLNHKFPVRRLFPNRKTRLITQTDFETLLIAVDREVREKAARDVMRGKRKYPNTRTIEHKKIIASKSR